MTEQAWIADNALFLRSIGRCLGGSNDFLAGLFAGRDVAQVEFIVVVDKCRLWIVLNGLRFVLNGFLFVLNGFRLAGLCRLIPLLGDGFAFSLLRRDGLGF